MDFKALLFRHIEIFYCPLIVNMIKRYVHDVYVQVYTDIPTLANFFPIGLSDGTM